MGSVALCNHAFGRYRTSISQSSVYKSINVLGWQPGAPETREHDFPKKCPDFFEIHRTSDNTMGSVDL